MGHGFSADKTSEVSTQASVGAGTKIWRHCQVREGAVIGRNCVLGKGVYVDSHVQVGDNVKIQNGVSIYEGVTLEDGVLCGPHCVFTNDRLPRAVNPDGSLKAAENWIVTKTLVRSGAAIGANSTIVCGVTVGRWSMVGAGSVVTHNVPDHGLVYGNPARLRGFVCPCGCRLAVVDPSTVEGSLYVEMACPSCQARISIPADVYSQLSPDS
jgi:UDP-2-acetamido-3-amino-2,3-dideoxy-glucuronate N-acetyltransferase